MQGLARAAALAVGLTMLVAAPAAGVTLEGEAFYVADNTQAPPPLEEQCTDNGDGTFTWHVEATGFALGPVPGTFTESADITVGALTGDPVAFPPFSSLLPFDPGIPGTSDPALFFSTGPLLEYDATFVIKDGSGNVLASGTKELTTAAPTDIGSCSDFRDRQFTTPQGTFTASGYYADARAIGSLRYEATIGTQSDSGTASVLVREANTTPSGSHVYDFAERFDSETVERVPATLDLTPASATNPVGTQHTITATVRDAEGVPIPGVRVLARVTGSVSVPFMSCTTGADGTCQLTYTGPALPGADLIEAVADSNNNGRPDPGEPIGSATKAWVLSTAGHVTGGGQVPGGVAFGFNAKSVDGDVKGNCNLVDQDTGTHVKCLTVDAIVRSGNHVTIYGQADVNGDEQAYRIDVEDNDEPGAGADLFLLQTSEGYSAGGTLLKGNVQVHD